MIVKGTGTFIRVFVVVVVVVLVVVFVVLVVGVVLLLSGIRQCPFMGWYGAEHASTQNFENIRYGDEHCRQIWSEGEHCKQCYEHCEHSLVGITNGR